MMGGYCDVTGYVTPWKHEVKMGCASRRLALGLHFPDAAGWPTRQEI